MKIFQDRTKPRRRHAERHMRWLLIVSLGLTNAGLAVAQEPESDPRAAAAGPASGPPMPLQPGPYVSPQTMSRLDGKLTNLLQYIEQEL